MGEPHAALVWEACDGAERSASSGCEAFLFAPDPSGGIGLQRVCAVDDIPLLDDGVEGRAPWQLAQGLLRRAFGVAPPPLLLERSLEAAAAAGRGPEARAAWQGEGRTGPVGTASAGLVLEAAAALLGVCSTEEFGGDARLRLEQLALSLIHI